MKIKPILYLVFLAATFSCERATKEDLKTEKKEQKFGINNLVPDGYSILMEVSGNLNLDTIEDKILVLRPNGEDSLSTVEAPLKRKLFILFGQSDKSYKVESQNDNALYYYQYDANFHDALVDLTIQEGQFTISHYGGFAQRWGRTIIFKFDMSDKKFYLCSDEYETFNAADEEQDSQSSLKTEKDFGKISFDQFDIYKK